MKLVEFSCCFGIRARVPVSSVVDHPCFSADFSLVPHDFFYLLIFLFSVTNIG